MQREYVPVSKDIKGRVIGKDGCVIEDIRRQSGATVRSASRDEEGFAIIGNAEQVEHAKRLILRKVEEIKEEIWELVDIPDGYKGRIIGKGGANLRVISEQTGAEVTRKRGGEVHIIKGTEKQREEVKMIIRTKVAYARLGGMQNEFNKVCCFIDGWNLPKNFGLKLEQVKQEDRIVIPGSDVQYRLKPTETMESESQELGISDNDPSYLEDLRRVTLESLHKIQREREANQNLEADMWCHFGTAVIRGPNEEEATEREWNSDEITAKFQSSAERDYWRVAFREGVDLVEDIFREKYQEKTPEEYTEYATRYDLTFLSPGCYQLKCKVWVTKEDTKERLADIPIPLSDVKNILEEIHFEDELTRSRCRGWLILPSRRYLQADILFPGCEFDCRFTIRGRTESAVAIDYVPKEEVRRVLSQYLSGLTLVKDDAFGLRLPEKIPEGFYLVHKRSSKRTVYTNRPGFNIILSRERSWRIVIPKERSRETTDLHLHCEDWDKLLSNGQWEPEVIVGKLPEFLQFVNEVQGIIVREMQRQTSTTSKIPPEILARGPLALEAYNNALAEGETCVKRVPLMMIGQDRSGKTSLKKSLRGIRFNPEEDSTVGIDVDQYDFKVTTEIWKTGKKDEEANSDTVAISFEHNAARLVAERLRGEESGTERERGSVDSAGSFDSEVTDMEAHLSESAADPQPIETSGDLTPNGILLEPQIPGKDVPDPTVLSTDEDTLITTQISEFNEIAIITEKLLQDDWVEDKTYVYSILWDFAGQSVYYATHPLFLTARAIYFLVYDLSQNPNDRAKPLVKQGIFEEIQDSFNFKTNFDYLDFWMTSVASLPSQHEGPKSEVLPEKLPVVFLVCTHADTPHDGHDPRKLARKIFGSLKGKPYGAQLCDVFCVDNTKSGSESECQDVMRLRNDVLDIANELPHLKESIPIKWLKYEKALQIMKGNGYKWISLETATNIASKVCNIRLENEIITLLNFLHDLRILIHFDDTPELNSVVVLDPQWLIDVFKKVITVRPYDSKEKKFIDQWRKLERDGILEKKLLEHVWHSLICQKAPYESLLTIMEKFSLLCPWPSSDDTCDEQYLVPSMLKSHPPKPISNLVASSQFPSLFLNFETGQVPVGFFPRFVLKFFQWCTCNFSQQAVPQFFNNFARFYILPEKSHSVVFICHCLSVEILVLGGNEALDTPDVIWARAVRDQVAFMIKCMKNEFFWVKDVGCEMCFLCPVCCQGRAVNYCRNHNVQDCKQEECLHFFSESKLSDSKQVYCTRSAAEQDNRVSVKHFAPWFPSEHEKQMSDEPAGGRLPFADEPLQQQSLVGVNQQEVVNTEMLLPFSQGQEEKSLTIPCDVVECLQVQSYQPKDVVVKLLENLQLERTSLERPEPETRKWIRCLARNAKCSNRPDVFNYLRQITPAGTTGPLLEENEHVLDIPQTQRTNLTVGLSGGDEWKLLAERLRLTPEKIRFLDKRVLNPADALLAYVGERCNITIGDLYDLLNECGLSGMADRL